MYSALRDQFLLDPAVIFLNHGSFGACPRPVFDAYQRWQLELERQPVAFLGRRAPDLLAEARAALGAYINADPDHLTFVTNATTGVNFVARSLALHPGVELHHGDEILTTTHEYGAVNRTWQVIAARSGAQIVTAPTPLPLPTPEVFVDALWQHVTPRTRIISISHITSPTALILPVAEVCARARAAGILTVVDGAHAPGQIPVDMAALGADFYSGNCHKWLCAPKGAGFLYARPEHHAWLEPAVISWDLADQNTFISRTEWQGTRDIAAFLAVPDAITFQQEHDWDAVRAACHELTVATSARVQALTGLAPLSDPDGYAQMVTLPLPPGDAAALFDRLHETYHIEIPVIEWAGKLFVRVSFQGYNTPADADALSAALAELLADEAVFPTGALQ